MKDVTIEPSENVDLTPFRKLTLKMLQFITLWAAWCDS
jgi:hypothetical protein